MYTIISLSLSQFRSNILGKLNLKCIKRVTFIYNKISIYVKRDGVSVNLGVGSTFTNIYIGNIKNNTFNILKKSLHLPRYVDDIHTLVKKNIDEIHELQKIIKKTLSLNSHINLIMIIKFLYLIY